LSESGGAITAAARGRSQVLYAAAGLSVAAALLHFWVTPEHFEEWWGYGVFFLVAAAAQAVYSTVVLLRPGQGLFVAGIFGNVAIVVLYIVTRTAGVPLFGPMVGVVEDFGVVDLVATAAELALAGVLVTQLRVVYRGRVVNALIALGAVLWVLRLTGVLSD